MKKIGVYVGVAALSAAMLAGCGSLSVVNKDKDRASKKTEQAEDSKESKKSKDKDADQASTVESTEEATVEATEESGEEVTDISTDETSLDLEAISGEGSSEEITDFDAANDVTELTTGDLDETTLGYLNALDTDYGEINWGVQYNLSVDYPGLVISVAPFMDGTENYLVVGVTNLYDSEISFSGELDAKAADDTFIGNNFIYEPNIGSGNTAICVIDCGSEKAPDGRIHWSDTEFGVADTKAYQPWECDWSLSGNPGDGYVTAGASIYAASGHVLGDGTMYAFLTDADGNILSYTSTYVDSTEATADTVSSDLLFFGDAEVLQNAKNVVMFANLCKN